MLSQNSAISANMIPRNVVSLNKSTKLHQILPCVKQRSASLTEISAVVKANAYGLGADFVALKLYMVGCRKFFVAHLEEAVQLRLVLPIDSIIYVLHGLLAGEEKVFIQYNLVPVINHHAQLQIWQNYAAKLNRKLEVILNFNTGLNRLEIPENETSQIMDDLSSSKNILVSYVMSHLACADQVGHPFNEIQLGRFQEILKLFPGSKASFANSSGIFLGQEYHFDLVRPGIALYGLSPCPNENYNFEYDSKTTINSIKPVISLTTKIIQIKIMSKADTIGYNQTETVKAGAIIATIPVGYADGYSRGLGHKAIVYIENYQAKVVGRVSMDLINIDITNIPTYLHNIGQQVELFGEHISLDSLAKQTDGFNYEYLTSLGQRYVKNYEGIVDLSAELEQKTESNTDIKYYNIK